MIAHILSFAAGCIVGGLVIFAALILWALRGYKWLATGK